MGIYQESLKIILNKHKNDTKFGYYWFIEPFLGVLNRYASDKTQFSFDKMCWAGPYVQQYNQSWVTDRTEIAFKLSALLRRLPSFLSTPHGNFRNDILNKLKFTDNGRVWLRFMCSDEMNNYICTLTGNRLYNDDLIKTFGEEFDISPHKNSA